MLKISGKNRKKDIRKKNSNKSSKISEKKPQYEEKFNEIILNDLVPEEKRSEFGLEDTSSKKGKSNKLNLNFGKKKSFNKKKGKKIQNNNQNKENDETEKKSSSKSNGKTTKATKINKNKKLPKKEKKEKSNIIEKNPEVIENTKHSKHIKKSHKNNDILKTKKRVKDSDNQEKVEIKETKEEIENTNNDIEVRIKEQEYISYENGDFRSNKTQDVDFKEEESKCEDLIWSKDKFPKK